MHRIDGDGATGTNQWTEGNPSTGTPATEITADWMNAVQNELENVIVTGGGIALSKPANNQLLLAIQTMLGVSSWQTGDIKLTMKSAADSGWVLCNDGSIGSASSGATTRANADTEALYTLLWNNVTDAWAPVTGGRGANAAADFAANKPLRLMRMLGRALAISGTGLFTGTFTANTGTEELTVPSNSTLYTGQAVTVSNSGGALPTGLAAATTYYVIRSSATVIKLATSLANAHAGTAIDITGAGTGTHTITLTYTARALGEHLGEETHVQVVAELAPHTHTEYSWNAAGAGTTGSGGNFGTAQTSSTGGGAGMNIMQPTAFVNAMIKL